MTGTIFVHYVRHVYPFLRNRVFGESTEKRTFPVESNRVVCMNLIVRQSRLHEESKNRKEVRTGLFEKPRRIVSPDDDCFALAS